MSTRRLAAAAAAVVCTSLLAACGSSTSGGKAPIGGLSAPTTTAATTTTAKPVDFSTVPNPLPGSTHGDLVASQPIDLGRSDVKAWRVLYRSESLGGTPTAVSGLVLAPAAAGSNRPVVAWAHGTTGSADACAPSATAKRDLSSTDTVPKTLADQLLSWVAKGYVVAATDYEGLGTPGPHPYLVGETAGRNVLDAVLAARKLDGAGAGATTVVYGLSQGGHAALWAGQIAPSWAPALDVRGVVAAAPFSEVDLLLPLAGKLPASAGYALLGTYGLAAANPKLSPADVLDPEVVKQAGIIETQCLGDVAKAMTSWQQSTGRPVFAKDPLTVPGWREAVLALKPATVASKIPVFVVQGADDSTVPAVTTNALVARMCGLGDTVAYTTYPQTGHGDSIVSANADIRAYVDDRVAAKAATATCTK